MTDVYGYTLEIGQVKAKIVFPGEEILRFMILTSKSLQVANALDHGCSNKCTHYARMCIKMVSLINALQRMT